LPGSAADGIAFEMSPDDGVHLPPAE
jgi:hypothetical protein